MASIAVVATVELDNTPPRVRLDLTDTAVPSASSATVTRLDPDGVLRNVRTPDGNALQLTASGATTVGLLYDYEMPYGQQVTYSTVESPDLDSGPVEVDEDSVWLVHPGVPALSMPVLQARGSLADETLSVSQGVYYVMGRQFPIVQTDGTRHGIATTLSVLTQSPTELNALRDLVQDAGVLLLNVPPSRNIGFDWSYIAVGDVKVSRFGGVLSDPYRTVDLPFVVVDMPIGGSQSQRTFVDLLSFSSLAAIQANYSTLADVLAGP